MSLEYISLYQCGYPLAAMNYYHNMISHRNTDNTSDLASIDTHRVASEVTGASPVLCWDVLKEYTQLLSSDKSEMEGMRAEEEEEIHRKKYVKILPARVTMLTRGKNGE
jgi:hypothetical protein